MEKLIIMGMEIVINRLSRASKQGQTPGGSLSLSSVDLVVVGFALIFLAVGGGLFSFVPVATPFLASTPPEIDERQLWTDKVRRRNEVVRMTVTLRDKEEYGNISAKRRM